MPERFDVLAFLISAKSISFLDVHIPLNFLNELRIIMPNQYMNFEKLVNCNCYNK